MRDFSIGFRPVEEIDILVALSMTAEGAGASLFLLSGVLTQKSGSIAGLCLVGLGVLLLFVHLGRPFQFWRVISKTTQTWISRGSVFTGGFLFFGAISVWFSHDGIPILPLIVDILAYVCALVVLLYTGFLFSSFVSVPFWNNPMLPILFLFQSLATGLFFSFFLSSLPDIASRELSGILIFTMALILTALLVTLTFTRSNPKSAAVKESVRLLKRPPVRFLYLTGALLPGFVISPVILLVVYFWPGGWQVSYLAGWGLLSMALVLRLIGDVTLRYCILKVGIQAPLI